MDGTEGGGVGGGAQPPPPRRFANKITRVTAASLDDPTTEKRWGGVGIMEGTEMIQKDDTGKHGWP